jgi:hypothetical protein
MQLRRSTYRVEDRPGNILIRSLFLLFSVTCFVIFTGCTTSNPQAQSDPNTVIQERPRDHEIHGEIGAMYGQSASRR